MIEGRRGERGLKQHGDGEKKKAGRRSRRRWKSKNKEKRVIKKDNR